jgi:hypothetical protein
MLSILIPAFNYNITTLVNELYRQAVEQNIDFEIIVIEDGSEKYLFGNEKISKLENCKYSRLNKNIGRSAIRNKLADESKYENLLFLDCDSEPGSTHFIQNYLPFCNKECIVLGGRIYDIENDDPNKSLILTYGRKRERYNQTNRKQYRNRMFMTPNFLISKSIFNKVRFNESIIGYGHEDSIFGFELQKQNYQFSTIDNPVIHKGLENNDVFIKKTEQALENLYRIYLNSEYAAIENDSKVLSMFLKIRKFKLQNLINFFFKLSKPIILKNLKGLHPSLLVFDFYKLGYLSLFANHK